MNYADKKTKEVLKKILDEGTYDVNPRPYWLEEDGSHTPAHTLSVNHITISYDLSKGQFPLIQLRPISVMSSIKELLWIYQDQSNSLRLLREKYGIKWWDEWKVDSPTCNSADKDEDNIGERYGYTVKKYDLMNKLLKGLKENPDGRRHIISLWQEQDFDEEPNGLKPCAFLTDWNVRHASDGDYLDMALVQRSSDFCTAGCINQTQYAIFLLMVANVLGYKAGKFTWFAVNVQIYDRHIEQAKEMLERDSITDVCAGIRFKREVKDWYDYKYDDIEIVGYPIEEIKKQNPQLKFPVAI